MAATIVTGSLREAMAAAMEACCCGGSGSGSGSGGSGSGSGSGSGGGGYSDCCGCVSFPSSLSFTVTASCIGTKSGTATLTVSEPDCGQSPPDLILQYSYYEDTSASGTASGTECDTGNPAVVDYSIQKVFSIEIECTTCVSTPTGHQWWLRLTWYDYSAGTLKSIITLMPIDQPSSCSPLIFPSIDKTVVCSDDTTAGNECYYVDGRNEPYTSWNDCLGSTFEVDISG